MREYLLPTLFMLSLLCTDPQAAQQYRQDNQQSSKPTKPKLQHGISYRKVTDISQYFVSEKLDGIRGYWNGKNLITRQGNLINSPKWFTLYWPSAPMDGELWLARGQFQPLMSCISKHQADENQMTSCWRNIRFMMFDLPTYQGDFTSRVKKMRSLLTQVPSPYLAMISQIQFKSMDTVEKKLNDVITTKGEGLMLHLASAHYKTGRNSALMKFKKHQYAEAIVIAHTKGKGKYQGKLGAIEVETENGVTFKIGSGFTDLQRSNPPKIGSTITFKYNGLTQAGIPRFARFWRIKVIEPEDAQTSHVVSLADM
ncbi:DNA ligase [Colwellia psychrerythraea]|uniref:DNA ligase (ATP) n=1 Tax=Colwellia psychrerythraea TaxID=28229 RepID=A0A099KNG4_COLPS|nr:DNA ligase [Colwellia psychrerythraea]KGJ91153.1 DNA ligase (ATP) [Colwellia psychrerythraea]